MTKTGHLFIDVRKIRERGRKIPKISRENVGFFTPSLTFSGSVVNLTKVFIFITLSIDRFTVDISSYEIVLGPQSLPTSPVFRQRSSPPDLFHHLRNNQTVKKHPSLFHVQLWNTEPIASARFRWWMRKSAYYMSFDHHNHRNLAELCGFRRLTCWTAIFYSV